MPKRQSKKNRMKNEDPHKIKRRDGGDIDTSVGMSGRDEPQRVGGRDRRLKEGTRGEDTAEGGR